MFLSATPFYTLYTVYICWLTDARYQTISRHASNGKTNC